MSHSDHEDSLTTLNTALNKSMILMDNPVECKNREKAGKSIKINTKIQSPGSSGETSDGVRKSILKKSRSLEILENTNPLIITENNDDSVMDTEHWNQNHTPRPHTLEDFLKEDTLITNPTRSTFSLEDLSDSEEMWVMDIPKTVDPRKLRGQALSLGKKSKLKIDDDRYCAVSRNSGCSLTWVFDTGRDNRPYKAVNVTPAGLITVRRKLPSCSKQTSDFLDATSVPFPSNLKIRHPFFGPSNDKEKSRRSKTSKVKTSSTFKSY